MLKTIHIEGTNSCNGKCVFCPIPTLKRERKIMPMELFKKIVDDCRKLEIEEVLPYLNGEPFLDPHIFERIEYINEALPNAKVTLYSNASLLTEEKAHKLASLRVSKVNFSMNAVTDESRMRLMGLPLQDAIMNVFRYKDLDPTVTIAASMILDSSYVDGTEALAFQHYWTPRGVQPRIFMAGNYAGKLKPSYRTNSICNRLVSQMSVLADGRVNLCCFDPEGEVILGDLNRSTVKEVWEGEAAKIYREKNSKGERGDLMLCNNCTTI